jgi:predicted O-methyltransferase YrrM
LPPNWRWRLRQLLRPAFRRVAEALGFDVVERNPYSPVPDVPPEDSPEWSRRASLVGLDFDEEAQFAWLEDELAPFLGEFAAALPDAKRELGFEPRNGYFQGVDAALLYSAVRWLKPKRLIEVGCGHSTMLAAAAARRNAAEGAPCQLTAIDPEPRTALVAAHARLERRPATEMPLARFLELEPGDLLFIDSSHTVKRGSDVNYLVLEVLPRLAAGIVVHFHDIFLPLDYPRAWFARGTFLAEQYLVHAFLLGNRDWEIRCAARALAERNPDRLRPWLAVHEPGSAGPSSLWLRRKKDG